MKHYEFNKLTLPKKRELIRAKYPNQFEGVCTSMIFADYTINVVCSLNGDIIIATAEPHNEVMREALIKKLQGNEFFVLNMDTDPVIKQAIADKVFSATNRKN